VHKYIINKKIHLDKIKLNKRIIICRAIWNISLLIIQKLNWIKQIKSKIKCQKIVKMIVIVKVKVIAKARARVKVKVSQDRKN
jgi:hypothetical protein